jgi:hypothetical protein
LVFTGIELTKGARIQFPFSLQCKTVRYQIGGSAEPAPDEWSDNLKPASLQLEVICGRYTNCLQVCPNNSLRSILRHTRFASDLGHLVHMQIGGMCVSIDQPLAEIVDRIKRPIQLHIYPKLKAGTIESMGSFFLGAPESEQQSEPAAVNTSEDTVNDNDPEQDGGMGQNNWWLSAPAHQEAPENQPCKVQIEDLLGVLPRNSREPNTQEKKGKSKRKTKQKPKQKALPKAKEYGWNAKLIFKDGINLLSTGSNSLM